MPGESGPLAQWEATRRVFATPFRFGTDPAREAGADRTGEPSRSKAAGAHFPRAKMKPITLLPYVPSVRDACDAWAGELSRRWGGAWELNPHRSLFPPTREGIAVSRLGTTKHTQVVWIDHGQELPDVYARVEATARSFLSDDEVLGDQMEAFIARL